MAPPRRRRLPRDERERQVVEAARPVFAERGFEAASMEDVATAAGVSKPMLYAYFGAKEQLFLRCAEHATEELIAAVDRTTRTGPHDVRLWLGIRATFDWIERNPGDWRLLGPARRAPSATLRAGLDGLHERVVEANVRWMVEASLEQGIAPAIARLGAGPNARAFVAVTEALADWWLEHPEEPKDLVCLRVMNFVWQGLEKMGQGKLWSPPAEGWR